MYAIFHIEPCRPSEHLYGSQIPAQMHSNNLMKQVNFWTGDKVTKMPKPAKYSSCRFCILLEGDKLFYLLLRNQFLLSTWIALSES